MSFNPKGFEQKLKKAINNSVNNATKSISCPKCGKKLTKTFSDIKTHGYTCPCGQRFTADDFKFPA